MLDKYHPNRQIENIGTPVVLKDIKPGQRFRYANFKSIHLCVNIIDGYLKIQKPCGWNVRVYLNNEKIINQTVYLTDHDTN
jgi:hypothetical protein